MQTTNMLDIFTKARKKKKKILLIYCHLDWIYLGLSELERVNMKMWTDASWRQNIHIAQQIRSKHNIKHELEAEELNITRNNFYLEKSCKLGWWFPWDWMMILKGKNSSYWRRLNQKVCWSVSALAGLKTGTGIAW